MSKIYPKKIDPGLFLSLIQDMSVLVGLPDDLCREILSDWLSITSWGKLDKAFCSSLRNIFLNVLQEACVSPEDYKSDSFVNWVRDRGVTLNEISLRPNMFTVASNRLSWKLPPLTIRAIKVDCCAMNRAVVDAINACTNLTSLSCGVNGDWTLLKLAGLSHFKIDPIRRFRSIDWQLICQTVEKQCTHLRTFDCPYETTEENVGLVSKIIENNPYLENVAIPVTNELMQVLVRHCYRTLRTVNIYGDLDVESFVLLFRKCSLLEQVFYDGEELVYDVQDPDRNWVEVQYGVKDSLVIRLSLTGMSELMLAVPKVGYLHLQQDEINQDVLTNLATNLGSHLISVELICDNISASGLRFMFENCPLLRCFSFSGTLDGDWSEALTGNKLEVVLLYSDGEEYALKVLYLCHYLNCVHFDNTFISESGILELIPALRNYRNVDGQPLKTDNSAFDHESTTECGSYDLSFDGVNFSGILWEKYNRLLIEGIAGSDSGDEEDHGSSN